MTRRLRLGTILIAGCFLAACGSAGDDEERKPQPPVEDTAFGDMVGTMDKARGVEDTTMQHKQDTDKAIEQLDGASEQGSSDH
jgi:hypothetical protein